jgi:DNA-binding NtrC family response regulator
MDSSESYPLLLVSADSRQVARLSAALSSPPFVLTHVEDGEAALHRLSSESCLAVIYDDMPHRVGLEALLKTGAALSPQPVQFVVVRRSPVEEMAGLVHAGADELLGAEVSVDELRGKLLEALGARPAIMSPVAAVAPDESSPLERLVGRSAAMTEIKRKLVQLAPVNSSVLFTGESGTGKSLSAEVLHQLSPRSKEEFRRVDCQALSRTLVESELFGHERGAFTDAKQPRRGVFELVGQGTVLLEEVSDLPGPTQSNILRYLETGEIRRIGASQWIHPQARILVATRENMDELAARRGVRKSLFYRLQGVRIHLPPLRDRREDIPDLVRHFLPRLSSQLGRPVPKITRRALRRLSAYHWPGNVRQLLNILEAILATGSQEMLDISDIPLDLRAQQAPAGEVSIPLGSTLAEAEKRLISGTLNLTGGNKVRAARMLGIALRTLYRKMKAYGI